MSHKIDFLVLSKNKFFSRLPFLRRRAQDKRAKTVIRIILVILGCLAAFIVFVVVLNLYNIASFATNAAKGKKEIDNAILFAKRREFAQAANSADSAAQAFGKSENAIKKVRENFLVAIIPLSSGQLGKLDYLLTAAEVLSKAMKQGSGFAAEIQSVMSGKLGESYSKFSANEKKTILQKIDMSGPELIGIKADLDLADASLKKVDCGGILWPFCGKITDLKTKTSVGSELLDRAIPLSRILPALFGFPEKKHYLVVLQNSDELRPTGGFIGTYGILETEFGEIIRFDTHDIYHMDMPVKDQVNVTPPAPIAKYLNPKWYMRDSNWSPDWPTSAKNILDFYDKENRLLVGENQINNFSGSFDGVIAINVRLVTDLLSLTGPVLVEGQEYTKDNFPRLLEYRVEKGYVKLGESSWQRKEVIGEIAKEIKIKLLDMPASRWQEITSLLSADLTQREMMMFFNDETLENIAESEDISGSIKLSSSDYLMVVDSNLAAYKTDAVMNKKLRYEVKEVNGSLYSKVIINYSHEGGIDWRTTKYRSFTRVFAPEGSELLKMAGGDDLQKGSEAGKEVFGAFITVDPGKAKELVFEYRLPDRIMARAKETGYHILLQKQPGSNVGTAEVSLAFSRPIGSIIPSGFSVVDRTDNMVSWKNDLLTDHSYVINF